MTESLESLLATWATAEQGGDVEQLDRLLTSDFYGVGPLGFLLPRDAWLGRHGDLVYQSFRLDDTQFRVFGDLAVVTARNATIGSYRGEPIPEAVRITLVAIRDAAGWRLATAHMSFLAGTRGAPPIPGSGR